MQNKGNTLLYLIPILVLLVSLVSSPFIACSEPPAINYFNASPTAITSGQAVTLQWDVSGATRANISGVGAVVPSGQAIVTPATTTTYVLTVPDSTLSLSVTIDVTSSVDTSGVEPAGANEPMPATSSTDNSSVPMVILRYDNLNTSSDDYLSSQIAVWHTYAKLPGSSISASAGYSADTHQEFTSSSTTGIPVKSPLIILPFREGMVCIIRNYSSLSYQYFKLGTASYYDQVDESDRLKEPGWGLMTTFSPGQSPFKIQKLDVAGVANITGGSSDDYNSRLFIVRILDENGRQVWTKLLPWSIFRSDSSDKIPKAIWRSVEVGDVTMTGDFSVEVLTESNECILGKNPSFNYLALAYEKVNSKDVNTRSIISEDGAKPDGWVRLYGQYGDPLAFNLCIRVEGSYLGK
ncbi:MAG: hypothetical protein WB588_11875 [Dehalococcoidia bacterium]